MRKSLLLSLFTLASILAVQSCSKEKSIETGSGGTPATGALVKDSNDLCLPPKIYGIYDTAKPLNDSNYVILSVNVTKPGFYRIKTDEQNGFSFADSGFFSVVGPKLVKLKATGTPILDNTTDFLVNFDSSVCGFSIHVTTNAANTNGNPNKTDTAWTFFDGNTTFHGMIDTAIFETVIDPSNNIEHYFFEFAGYMPNSQDTVFNFKIEVPQAEAIPAISYPSNTNFMFDFNIYDRTLNPPDFISVYLADPARAPGYTMQTDVTYYNESTRIAEGTFGGTVRVRSGGTVNIQRGKFKVWIGK